MRIEFEDGRIVRSDSNTDPYYRLFLSNVALNESCYKCKYKGVKSQADITIGDYWGGDILNPDFYDLEGTSLVVVRSEKGQKLFDKIRANANVVEVDYDSAAMYNSCLVKSVERPSSRDYVFKDLEKMDFQKLSAKYAPISKKTKFKEFLNRIGLLKTAQIVWHRVK